MSKVRLHLAEAMALARHWGRTLVLPRVRSSRIGGSNPPRGMLCFPRARSLTRPRATLCNPRAALLLPALPYPRAALLAAELPFAASASPFAASASPFCSPPRRPLQPARRLLQPTRCPAAARPAACSPAGRRPAARTALLRAALLVDALLPVRRPIGSHTALPFVARSSGRPILFDTWLDNLQLYLLSDSRDIVSLFDHTSGASLAPPATADSKTRSEWLNRAAAARLAVRNHLPLAERAHFGQHKTTKALYDVVVARSSSPATPTLGRLILPYLFPELSAFATLEDLVTRLRTSDTRYRAALPPEFLDRNPPPMYITLYFIVTRLPDSLRVVRDQFLALDPTNLTVDLLEKHLLAAETTVVAVGAARGTPRTPFFEGCSPSPLAPSYASAAAVHIRGAEEIGVASALSGKRRSSKGKGGRGGGGGSGGGGGGGSGGGGGGRGGGRGGSGGGSGGFGGGGGGGGGSSGSGGGGSGGGWGVAVQRGGSGGGHRQQQQLQSETPTPQQLREWFAQRGASRGSVRCPYVIRTGRAPCWSELHRSGVDIFALDYDAILAAIYALSVSAEGYCYLCVPPDPGIEVAALGASEFALPGTAPAEALHTFTQDSGASRYFFRDSTTLTPLPAPVPYRCPPGCVCHYHHSLGSACVDVHVYTDGRHLATFTHWPGSSLYTPTTEPPQVATSTQVSASGSVAAPCSCRLLSHQTHLWHHRLGHQRAASGLQGRWAGLRQAASGWQRRLAGREQGAGGSHGRQAGRKGGDARA
ncbi:unnamed protein product [Closterium sp. NIES-53]